MTFITFIYRIGNNPTAYFGKYVTDSVSDDHNGLDMEVKYALVDGLNKYREQKGYRKPSLRNIRIGVLGFAADRYIPTYSSEDEIKSFDTYIVAYNYTVNTFVNGKQFNV